MDNDQGNPGPISEVDGPLTVPLFTGMPTGGRDVKLYISYDVPLKSWAKAAVPRRSPNLVS